MTCAGKFHAAPNNITAPTVSRIGLEWLAAIWRRTRRALEYRRQCRALRELDDDQLKDIGISREQALREANKLFWTRV